MTIACPGCGRRVTPQQRACTQCGFAEERGGQGYLAVSGALCMTCPWFTDQPYAPPGFNVKGPPYGCGFVSPAQTVSRKIERPDEEFCSMHPLIQKAAQDRAQSAVKARLEELRAAKERREANKRAIDL